MASRIYKILLVDDDPCILRALVRALECKGYQVTTAFSGGAAIDALSTTEFDLVITDLNMQHMNGLTVLKKAKELNPKTKVIILSANNDGTAVIDALRLNVDDYIFKPCDLEELWKRVADRLDKLEPTPSTAQAEGSQQEVNTQILNMLKIMSHDIRGSLVSIGACLKLLQRGTYGHIEEEVAAKLNDLFTRTTKLIGMSEEFLGKACSVNGGLNIEKEKLDLRQDVVEPILEELSEEVQDQGITLDNRLNASASLTPIKGDKVWLKTVFRNLLKNGIKYGGKGCTLGIDLENRGSYSQLNVFNNGRPIPEESRDRLFTKFSRLSGEDEKNSEGMGLGLYMIKEVIRKHGGEMWYEPGEQGSNFVFTLPHE